MLMIFFITFKLSFLIAESPSADELKEGIYRNFEKYNNMEFVYNVKSKNKDGVFENTQNTFRLHIPSEGYPWQCIVVKKENDEGQLQIDNFTVFNGRETHVFSQAELREGNWSHASKIAGFGWDRFMSDSYPIFLAASAVGIPFTTIDSHAYEKFWEQEKEFRQSPKEKIVLDGYDVWIYRYKKNNYEIESGYLANGNSYFLVSISIKDTKTNKIGQKIQVETVGEKYGVVFPKKGHVYMERAYATVEDSKYKGTDYFFEVINVERLENVTPENWLPEVLPGTVISDHINGGTITIPFSDEQRKKIIEKAENMLPASSESKYTLIFRIVCITLGIIMIIFGTYRSIIKKIRKK
jgi:hypothetical protein